jgi:Fe-S cluster assembly protein SufD
VSALLDSLAAAVGVSDAATRSLADIARDGLPTTRDEAWKYTSLRALERRTFANGDVEAAHRRVDAATLELAGIDGPRVVLVNGAFRADLSRLPAIDGLSIEPDDAAARAQSAIGDASTGRSAVFDRLNLALARSGVAIRVAAGVTIAEAVHVVYAGVAADGDVAWHARSRIELGAGARLATIEHHLAPSPNAHLATVHTDLVLDANATLDRIEIQDAARDATLVRRTDAALGESAHLSTYALEIGGALARHDVAVGLSGRGARYDGRGVIALGDRQHGDVELAVTHVARDTTCDLDWRGIADGRARVVLLGGITVAAGADGADARLSNKNLLLSPSAEIDTRPVLEIHADEVKASHGATVGQLDERALFYLRSRGLDAASAKRLLTIAFCREVLDALPIAALREPLAAALLARLALSVEGA